jgi:hypothetical protein
MIIKTFFLSWLFKLVTWVIRPEALNMKEPWKQILNQLIIDG